MFLDARKVEDGTHPILQLGPFNYDIEAWVRSIGRKDVRRIPLPSGQVEDILSQFSSPFRLGKVTNRTSIGRSTSAPCSMPTS